MIKPGIKIGPKGWQQRLKQSNARFCEVWFNLNEADSYLKMFSYLNKRKINTGLHFWGTINNTWEPNISYPGKNLSETINLIKKTIDIAAKFSFTYVNIHCGNRAIIKLNLKKSIFSVDQSFPIISPSLGAKTQFKSLLHLHRYANKQKVLLLTETIPARMAVGSTNNIKNRISTVPQYSVPVDTLIKNSKQGGFYLTNDLCHTFSDEYDKPKNKLYRALYKKTKAMAPLTKLIHINTLIPPYNGTDCHLGITNKDFRRKEIFPTKTELTSLLAIFRNRKDVWAVNEPHNNHLQNYFSLKKILSTRLKTR